MDDALSLLIAYIGQYPDVSYPVRLLTRKHSTLIFKDANGQKFHALLREGEVKSLEQQIRQMGGLIHDPVEK